MNDPVLWMLAYLVMPLWLLAGIADWACHRKTDIAHTSGVRESALHLLMFAEVGVALLAGIFLEINAAVLVLMVVAFLLHEATAMWDVSYAGRYRRISPFEQHVHSFLELLPLMAIVLVAIFHWDAVLSLLGAGEADWSLRLKTEPIPLAYVTTLLVAVLLLEVLPFLEEFVRTWRARRHAMRQP